jgi:hypothetical protein
VLRELEYKDRLIVDVHSRLQWRWPSGKDGRPALVPAAPSKRGGYAKSETVQYAINDRRIFDIFKQQEFYREWDETHPLDAHSSETEPMPTHGEWGTESRGVQNSAVGVTNKPDAHSNQNPDGRCPLKPELESPMPTHHECRTNHLNLTDHLNLTSKETVIRQAAKTAAYDEGNPAVQDTEQTEMTDLEFEERKALLRRQAEQLKALYGVEAGPLASRVSGNDETASAAAATGD